MRMLVANTEAVHRNFGAFADSQYKLTEGGVTSQTLLFGRVIT
ncbi:hypothetical protein [Mesorhizobium sp. ZC-5]|nr:hypothetical protein [Mesorhizobium sp. ZC-5]MCV3244060.1 hypothetical protein [Mesorhizobium sp. ZC-5]